MSFETYELINNAQTVYIRYRSDEGYMYFIIHANNNDASGIYRNEDGTCLERFHVKCQMSIQSYGRWMTKQMESYLFSPMGL